MQIPVGEASAEIVVKGSRFRSEIFPIDSQQLVRAKLSDQKKKYDDATHVVHAFILGNKQEIAGMSDDGEPSGTAGRPVLDLLRGYRYTNILLTITRWFGGTLLGTGGLVHAYSDAAKQVFSVCSFEELIEKRMFSCSTDYQSYQLLKRLIAELPVFEVQEVFDTQVHLSGAVAKDSADFLADRVFDLTNGKSKVLFQ